MPDGGPKHRPKRIASCAEASQRQLGLLWGAVSIALLVLASRAEQLTLALPQCTFRALLGIPCPTCGITRATLALAELDVLAALRINPLASALLMALVIGGVVAGLAAFRGRPLREPNWNLRPVERLGIVTVVLANWAYLVSRGL